VQREHSSVSQSLRAGTVVTMAQTTLNPSLSNFSAIPLSVNAIGSVSPQQAGKQFQHARCQQLGSLKLSERQPRYAARAAARRCAAEAGLPRR
jgi:cytochrome c oxidase assembly protein Cox11